MHNMYTLPYIFFVRKDFKDPAVALHTVLYTTTATIWNNFHTRFINNFDTNYLKEVTSSLKSQK